MSALAATLDLAVRLAERVAVAAPPALTMVSWLLMSTIVLGLWRIADRFTVALRSRRTAARTALLLTALVPVMGPLGAGLGVGGWLPPALVGSIDEGVPLRSTSATRASQGTHRVESAGSAIDSVDPIDFIDPIVPPGTRSPRAIGSTLLLATWAVGAAYCLLRLCVGLIGVFGLVRGSVACSPSVQVAAAREVRRAGLRFPPRVLACARIDAPLSVALPVPIILVPVAPRHADPPGGFLAHECAHLAAGDSPVGLAQRIVGALLWFHPWMHALSHRIDDLAERLADRAAIRSVGSPVRYARALLEVAAGRHGGMRGGPVVSVRGRRPCDLAARVDDLLSENPTPEGRAQRWGAALSFVLIGGALLGCRAPSLESAERVLLLSASPDWEFRYLKSHLLARDDLITNTLLLFADEGFEMERSDGAAPIDRMSDVAADYEGLDTLILCGVRSGDLDQVAPEHAAMALRRFVHAGGRLIVVPGESGLGGLRSPGMEPMISHALGADGDAAIARFGEGVVVVVLGEGTWKVRGSSPGKYERSWSEWLTAEAAVVPK